MDLRDDKGFEKLIVKETDLFGDKYNYLTIGDATIQNNDCVEVLWPNNNISTHYIKIVEKIELNQTIEFPFILEDVNNSKCYVSLRQSPTEISNPINVKIRIVNSY